MQNDAQAIPIEELLSHRAWVRSLARSLVADLGDAEDLVQETWLAALRRPPIRSANPRAWLGRVIRNAAHQRRRGDAARVAREAETREQAVPTPEALVERIDAQRMLAEELIALSEPTRQMLLLRFYEDLTPREIAARTGTPAGTVRWRLKSGLDELRARLDARSGGSRGTWAMALAPFVRSKDAPVGAAVSVGAALPVTLTIGLAVVAASIFAFTNGWNREAPDETSNSVAGRVEAAALTPGSFESDEQSPTRAPVLLAANEPADVSSAASGSSAELAAHISARVVDLDGAPIPSVEVRRTNHIDGLFGHEPLATTNFAGQASFDWAVGAPTLRITLVAENYAARNITLEVEPGAEIDAGTIELEPGAVVSGRVLDEEGRPIVGAWVDRAPDFVQVEGDWLQTLSSNPRGQMRTGALGDYRLIGLPLGSVRLTASASEHFARATEPLVLTAGEHRREIDLALEPWPLEARVAGRVVGPNGEPVKAVVSAEGEREVASATCDEAGRFALPVNPAERYRIRARVSDRPDWSEPVLEDIQGGRGDLVLRFRPGIATTLILQTTEDEPIPAYQVLVRPIDPNGSRTTQSSAGSGSLALTLPYTTCFIDVQAEGHPRKVLGPFEPDAVPERIVCELETVQPGVTGRIVDEATGDPIAGAEVLLMHIARNRGWHSGFPVRLEPEPAARATTDAAGRYRLVPQERAPFGLPPGVLNGPVNRPMELPSTITVAQIGELPEWLTQSARDFVVLADAEGYAAAESEPFQHDGKATELRPIELTAGGSIVGRLLVEPGETAADRRIVASRGDTRARSTTTDADGHFRFERLTAGPWFIAERRTYNASSGAEGDEPWPELPSNVVVHEGEPREFVLDQTQATRCTLDVAVRIDDEAPATLTARLTPPWLGPNSFRSGFGAQAKGKKTSNARLAVGAAGSWWLTIAITTAGGARLSMSQLIELQSGAQSWERSFTTGAVEVHGLQPRSFPHRLTWESHDLSGSVRVHAEGRGALTLSGIPTGRVAIEVMTLGGATPPTWTEIDSFELQRAETRRVEVN